MTGCPVFFDAIGDPDYDGNSYRADWPASTTAGPFPTPFLQGQPTTVGNALYPRIQFVPDTSATELNTACDLESGAGCVLPPKGPGHFYPYWTQAKVGGPCVWEFGNMTNGNTFGKDLQYGAFRPGRSALSPAPSDRTLTADDERPGVGDSRPPRRNQRRKQRAAARNNNVADVA